VSQSESPPLLSYEDAAEVVRRCAGDLRAAVTGPDAMRGQTVPLLEARGRVLAEGAVADRDQPPFRRATRDGFACRAADAGGPLRIVGHIRAGDPAALSVPPVGRGEAVEIMTGSPVPDGADCVVMVEHVAQRDGAVAVEAGRRTNAGDNIVAAGAEASRGAVVLAAGTRLAANHIGAAAACGYSRVAAYRRPRVAVLATGDELVELDEPLLPFQIRNSNSYSLAAQVGAAGGEPVRLPVAKDDPSAIEAAIRDAMRCDLLLLSGGVSAGRYDFVETVLLSLGSEFLFTGVLMQPGRPVVFGRMADGTPGAYKYFFGLPGNPVSTLVTFALFVRPMIDALSGALPDAPRFVMARLTAEFRVKRGLTRFLPSRLVSGAGFSAEVTVIPWQGSGDLASTAKANCYLVVPPDRNLLEAGETVSVLLD
jgi:molybdopterin molybdotransferase